MDKPSSGNVQPTNDERLLAELGYKQEFKRDFHRFELFGLGFSLAGVLPSIATVLVYSIPYGGPVVMIWGWLVCSFFLMFIGMVMAELGSAAPTLGCLYYWTFKYSSKRYRYFLCWVIGYINTMVYISALAGVEWGCAVQVMAAVSIGTDLAFVPTAYHIYGVFLALTLLTTGISLFGTKIIARLQTFFTTVNMVICLVVIVALPANAPAELKNDAAYAFTHFENLSSWPNGFAFILGFLAPLTCVGGFDSTVHVSEEARNANIAVPWAIMSSVTLACVLGWAINIAMAFTMGKDLPGILQNPIGQPFATILLGALGKRGTLGLWAFIVMSQLMMTVNTLVCSSRQIFALSRDGALPFSKYLYYISPSQRIPSRGVWFSVFIAILLGLIPLAGPTASGALFSLIVIGQYVCITTVICARWLGPTEFKPGPFNLGIMSLPVSIVAATFMTVMFVVLCFPFEPEVTPGTMNYAALVFGVVVLLATFYYFCPGIGGHYWFEGPAVTAESEPDEKGTRKG